MVTRKRDTNTETQASLGQQQNGTNARTTLASSSSGSSSSSSGSSMRAGTRQVAAAEGDENRHVVVACHVAVELNLAAGALSCGSGACAVARKRGTVGCERAAWVASGHRSASFGYGACPGNPTFYSIFGTERAVPSGWVPSGPYEKIVWIHRIARLRKRY